MLVIKQSDAAIIADLMLGGDGLNPSDLLDEIQLSAVQEAMNQMMGSAATSMSTIFSKKVDISPPTIELLDVANGEGENSLPNTDLLVKISFRLRVGDLIDSNIMQLLPLPFAKGLVQELLGGTMQDSSASQQQAPPEPEPMNIIRQKFKQPKQLNKLQQLSTNRCMSTQNPIKCSNRCMSSRHTESISHAATDV